MFSFVLEFIRFLSRRIRVDYKWVGIEQQERDRKFKKFGRIFFVILHCFVMKIKVQVNSNLSSYVAVETLMRQNDNAIVGNIDGF